jgi:glycosyltransferase involved in cell wall biosynthesis
MLAILTTHPIQYQVPIWRALATNGSVPFEVWYLTRHGVEASHDAQFGKAFRWDIDLWSGYPYRFLNSAAGASPTEFWKCRLVEQLPLHERGVEALWIQGWQVAAYWQAASAAKAAGSELWLRAESNDKKSGRGTKGLVRTALHRVLFRRVDRFLCIGTANRRLYLRAGAPGDRLYDAPYAIDNVRFASQAETARRQRSAIRRRWGVPEGAFCVLFCGKLIGKKRPDDLVEAVRDLQARTGRRDIHILFAGTGEREPRLRAKCEVVFAHDAGGLGHHGAESGGPPASFVGFLNQTEISQAYVAADCLVLPSDHDETWGLVVNEAFASGLPCLVSSACGCAEDLVAPECRFRCGDIAELSGKIEQMAAGGLSRSPIALPDIADTVNAVVGAYRDLVEARKSRRTLHEFVARSQSAGQG